MTGPVSTPTPSALGAPAPEEQAALEPAAYAFYGAALPAGLADRVFEPQGRLLPRGALRPVSSARMRRTATEVDGGYPTTAHDVEAARFRRVRDALRGGVLYVDPEGTVWSPVVRVSIEWKRLPEDAS